MPRRWPRSEQALPALGAGIYLNTGSAGPLPAETAAAMADLAELRAPDGPGARRVLLRGRSSSAWPRRGRRIAAVLAADVDDDRAHPLDDRRHERRDLGARLAARRPGGHDPATSIRAALGPLSRPASGPGSSSRSSTSATAATTTATLAAFDAAITPRTRLVVDLPRPVDDRGGPAHRAIARLAHAARRDRGRRRRPGRRGHAGLVDDLGVDYYAVAGPEMAPRTGGDRRALGLGRRARAGAPPACRAGSASMASPSKEPASSSARAAGSRRRTTTSRR